jgi:hypothetical protein
MSILEAYFIVFTNNVQLTLITITFGMISSIDDGTDNLTAARATQV